MPVIINTNSAATMAAANLATSSASLQKSLNRLSSGSRIVDPEDDAGGLAVSMKLTAAAHRQTAVANNIGNSTSYLQTQDGALGVLSKVLTRIGELKTLYVDPTKNASDRANYDAEFGQLQNQILSLSTEKFNGMSLFGSTGISVGVDESNTSSVAMSGVNLLGATSGPAWTNVSGVSPGTGWTASTPAIVDFGTDTDMHGNGTLTTTQSNISGPYAMNFGFDLMSAVSAGQVTLSGGGTGKLDFANLPQDGNPHAIAINVDAAGTAAWSLDSGAQTGSIANFGSVSGGAVQFSMSNFGPNDLHILSNFTLASTGGGGGSGNISSVQTASNLGSLNLSTITSALQDVATYRASNGAQQSRLGFAAEVLTANQTNLEAANSRISDVDVAEESTHLARFNVLMQAGTAMLSQANQSTQIALKLLS
jgi:flagellin